MSKKIKIKSAPGDQSGWTEGTDDLVNPGLYFEQTSTAGQFLLYGPNPNPPPPAFTVIPTTPSGATQAGPVQTGTGFTFTWKGFLWTITSFVISESAGTASGKWATSNPPLSPDAMPSDGDTGGDPESGTFQANDTGQVEGESSVSANA